MITAQIQEGYEITSDSSYPIEITNNGESKDHVILTANDTIFSNNEIDIEPGITVIVYATTLTETDVITITGNDNVITLDVTVLESGEFDYGTDSGISLFDSPDTRPKVIEYYGQLIVYGTQVIMDHDNQILLKLFKKN